MNPAWWQGRRGAWLGTAAVAALLVLAVVMGITRDREAVPLAQADAVLERLAPLPPAGAGSRAPAVAGLPLAQAAARMQTDVDAAWRASVREAGVAWDDRVQPLPDEALRILAGLDVPRDLALAYGVAFVAASDLQTTLDIRDHVSHHARRASAADRHRMALNLRRQEACLAGVYLGSRFTRDRLTAPVVARLLDAGLVRGTRDPSLDAWLVRGARSGRPATCRVF